MVKAVFVIVKAEGWSELPGQRSRQESEFRSEFSQSFRFTVWLSRRSDKGRLKNRALNTGLDSQEMWSS